MWLLFLSFTFVAIEGASVRPSNRTLDSQCNANPASEFAHLNTPSCVFTSIYKCPAGVLSGSVTDLSCSNVAIQHIHDVAQSYLAAGGRDRLNVNLMWSLYQTRMESYNIVLNQNVFPKSFFDLIQSMFISIDAPTATLHPSFFEATPNLVSLSMELMHPVNIDTWKMLKTFTGYFELPKLEFLSINIAEEIMAIDKNLVVGLPSLKCLKLVGFRYTCNCGLQDLLADLRTRSPSPISGTYANSAVDPYMQYVCDVDSAYCDDSENGVSGAEHDETVQPSGIPVTYLHLPNCDSSIDPPDFSYPVQLRLTCSAENFAIEIHDATYYLGAFSFEGFYEQSDEACKASNGAVSISVKPGTCGVKVIGQNPANGKNVLEGVITVKLRDSAAHLANHALVEPVSEIAYRVKCTEGDLFVRASPVVQNRASTKSVKRVENGNEVQLYVPEKNFPVGKYTFQIQSADLDPNIWDLNIQSCWATHENNSLETDRFDIIKNGCPIDPECEAEVLADNARVVYRYTITPFKFRNKNSGNVFVHCKVGLCDANSATFVNCMNEGRDASCADIWDQGSRSAHRQRVQRISRKHSSPTEPNPSVSKLSHKSRTENVSSPKSATPSASDGLMAGHLIV